MSALWITITLPDEADNEDMRRRAVDALHDSGITVYRAWVDHRTPADIRAQADDARIVRRDPAGVTLGAGVTALFGGLAVWLFTLGGWWALAAVACALLAVFGLVGLTEALHRKPRTSR
ncbi:hypothetical protein Q7689_00640 [Nocardiopsis tropica]|uniref:hypothetical protein n=1 Tax=Nocardiopsis tropica TaxID=109330 RepID=UPI002E88C321|nr:hypothetical protein [Nocardiopsis tropica]